MTSWRQSDESLQRISAEIAVISERLGRAPNASELAYSLGMDRQDLIDTLIAMVAHRDDRAVGLDAESIGGMAGAYDSKELTALPEFQRTVLVLRFFHSLSQTEIAKRLNISARTVYDGLTQALARVRDGDITQPGLPNQRSGCDLDPLSH